MTLLCYSCLIMIALLDTDQDGHDDVDYVVATSRGSTPTTTSRQRPCLCPCRLSEKRLIAAYVSRVTSALPRLPR
jgi:hypothetical protein